MAARSLLIVAGLLTTCSIVYGLPTGAPTAACVDLRQQHAGISPSPCEGESCPFTMSIESIDGGTVPEGKENLYRCGSVHTSEFASYAYGSQ